VRTGKKTLMALSMWKKKAGTPNVVENQPLGPNVRNDTGTIKNIRQKKPAFGELFHWAVLDLNQRPPACRALWQIATIL